MNGVNAIKRNIDESSKKMLIDLRSALQEGDDFASDSYSSEIGSYFAWERATFKRDDGTVIHLNIGRPIKGDK